MDTKGRSTGDYLELQCCQCGWTDSSLPLAAIWAKEGQIVSRICPHCGTPSPLRNKITFPAQPSQLTH